MFISLTVDGGIIQSVGNSFSKSTLLAVRLQVGASILSFVPAQLVCVLVLSIMLDFRSLFEITTKRFFFLLFDVHRG